MAETQGMLFPPLDDEGSQNNEEAEDRVLPQEIKDRFSKVRSLLRGENSANDEDGAKELKRKQEAAALEAARAVQEEVNRLQNGIAELEAMCAIQEQQLLNPFLDNQGEDEDSDSDVDEDEQEGMPFNDDNNNNPIVFQALPSIVMAIEPDSDADTRSHGNASRGSNEGGDSGPVVATQDILCDA